jgi:hypothetical protein
MSIALSAFVANELAAVPTTRPVAAATVALTSASGTSADASKVTTDVPIKPAGPSGSPHDRARSSHGRSIPLLVIRMLCSGRNIQAERSWEPWFLLFLRRSGLDQLPRLFNILRGDRDFSAFREGWEVDLQRFPPTDDMAPDPLDDEHPDRASVDEFIMWDDEIDGLRLSQIGIDHTEGTDELGNEVLMHALLLLRSRKRMREGVRQFLRWYLGLRGPRGPQRPMPA